MSVLKLQRRTVLLLTSVALALLLALLILLVSRTTVHAADNASVISVRCEGTHHLPDDPIVFPNQPGKAHMHEFIGNPSTNAGSTFVSMQDARSSVKCDTHADSSGYWVPSLYKGTTRIPVSHAFFYYRGPPGVQPFPADLKMIAGGDTRNPAVPWEHARGLSWSCLDSGPFYEQPPNCTGVGKPIKAHIQFPNCWDGKNLDSPNHMSHMAYWSQKKQCPASHPVRLPRLRQNVAYDIKDGRGTYLSSDLGQPGGTQLHADFWNTWDQTVLRDAVETCINGNINCKRLQDNDPRLR